MTTNARGGEAPCEECVKQNGLCAHHAKHVCPQLKQPSWYRLVGSRHYDTRHEESPEGRKIRERKERKRAARRLLDAIGGARMRNTSSRKAA
ncbi:MAG: hypothetical protein C0503_00810 [Gemmatimonas sp.]|nr:hypothetical protein [Gemmatimonas sp.]